MKLDLAGHSVLPGLINAHDHLEFNLFPCLGRGVYPSATEWARDIYHPERSPIAQQLKVPKAVRLMWGALKNLLSGVTTVCHHNPYDRQVFGAEFPVRVVRRFGWAHSLAFEADLAARLRKRKADEPFVIHCGEGTNASARRELEALDAAGGLDDRTAIVHGVALDPRGVALMKRRRAALIWCPTSNSRMLGKTVSRRVLGSGIPIALATDSGLSAPVDLLDELAVARADVPANRLLDMVTAGAQRILRLKPNADWIAVRSDASDGLSALCNGAVALVVNRGRIRLISPELARQLPADQRRRFQMLRVEGRCEVLVDADVHGLRRAASRYLGEDLRLAGKRVLA